MTTDERLDRLVERHEALVMTIELQNRQWEDRFNRSEDRFNRLFSIVERLERSVELLVQVAQEHERRLDRLEGPAAG